MTTHNLIIALFVHDMKAPLAVIELGARTLLKTKKSVGHPKEEQHLLETILTKKNQAVTLLNKILDLDLSDKCSMETKRVRLKSLIPNSMINTIKQVVNRKKKPEPLTSVVGTLEQLKALLLDIIGCIKTLQQQMLLLQERPPNNKTTLNRMARNAKTSVHHINNAVAILQSRASFPGTAGYKLSTIVKETLVEIFDLIDPKTSAAIQKTQTLTGLAALLTETGIHMRADDHQWDTEYTLQGARLKQVLVNLLMNALKYRETRIDVEISYKNRQLIISVTDDGVGIPAQFHRYIFKKRFQIKSENDFPIRGHGIGLAGSQALLKEMNGSLHLKSDVDRQTCFSAKIDGVDILSKGS